ncbi:MAG: toxin CcdB [Alphaproteobacteria bacterium]|jgi:toxin CcdB
MAKYDVFPNPDGAGYLLDVQADLLEGLNSRIVVPLFPLNSAPQPARTLNPVFDINGVEMVMVTQFLAAAPSYILKSPVATVADRFSDITAALDFLFQGY